jgi:murein DD-endopeptidase MepM/ murein hydrolase activator NlpD
LKREIPQKVDSQPQLANSEVAKAVFQERSALFRRTRSSAFFGLALTAGTISALLPHTKAVAFNPARPVGLATVPSVLPESSDASIIIAPEVIQPGTLQAPVDLSQASIAGFSSTPVGQLASTTGAEVEQHTTPSQVATQVESGQPIPNTPGVDSVINTEAISTAPNQIDLARSIVVNPGQTSLRESDILIYQVNEGDNLTSISERYRVTPEVLIQANHITNPDIIKVDEKLLIPTSNNVASSNPSSTPTVATFPATPLHGTSLAAQALQNNRILEQPLVSIDESPVQQPVVEAPSVITEQRTKSAELAKTTPATSPVSRSLTEQRVASMLGVQEKIQPVGLKDSSSSETFDNLQAKGNKRNLALLTPQPIQARSSNQLPVFQKGTTVARRSFAPSISIPALELPPLAAAGGDSFLPSSMGQGNQKYIWPANGAMTSGYGWRWGRMHRGIDIAAPIGTPIIAAAPGVVLTSGWNDGGYGYMVEIQHPDGSMTRYAHNDRLYVRKGDTVQQGQRISDMGSTGRSTGPHLHFEIHTAGRGGAINPMTLLAAR